MGRIQSFLNGFPDDFPMEYRLEAALRVNEEENEAAEFDFEGLLDDDLLELDAHHLFDEMPNPIDTFIFDHKEPAVLEEDKSSVSVSRVFEETPPRKDELIVEKGTSNRRICVVQSDDQVAKRTRTRVIFRSSASGDRKLAPITSTKPPSMTHKTATLSTLTTAEGSCLSTGGTGEISSAKKVSSVPAKKNIRRRVRSAHIHRRAEAIIKLLSCGGCASEVRIRQLLGDSPDTSKALRMLLKMEEVNRSGAGGRGDPFMYKIAAELHQSTVV